MGDRKKESERERKGPKKKKNGWKCECVRVNVAALTHASVQQKTDRDAETQKEGERRNYREME